MNIQIATLSPDDDSLIEAAAEVLVAGFLAFGSKAWPDRESALPERKAIKRDFSLRAK